MMAIDKLLHIPGGLEAGGLVEGCTHAQERSERTLAKYPSLVEYEACLLRK